MRVVFEVKRELVLLALLSASAGIAAGCGGGNSTNTPLPPPTPAPAASASSAPIPQGKATTIPLPSAGGITTTVALPPTSGSSQGQVTTTTTASTSLPTGLPGLKSVGRHTKAAGVSLYVTATVSDFLTFNGSTTVSSTLPSTPAAGTVFALAGYDSGNPGSWAQPIPGSSCTLSGATVTCTISSNGFTLLPGRTYAVALYNP